MTPFDQFLSCYAGTDDERPKQHIAPDIDAVRLRDVCAAYHHPTNFEVGDLVRIRAGYYVPNRPPSGLFIVMDLADDAEICWDPSDLETFGICFDVYVGFYDEDGDFTLAPFDSRRLERVREGDLAPPKKESE